MKTWWLAAFTSAWYSNRLLIHSVASPQQSATPLRSTARCRADIPCAHSPRSDTHLDSHNDTTQYCADAALNCHSKAGLTHDLHSQQLTWQSSASSPYSLVSPRQPHAAAGPSGNVTVQWRQLSVAVFGPEDSQQATFGVRHLSSPKATLFE